MSATSSVSAEFHDDIVYPDVIPFVIVHLTTLAAFFTGVSWGMVALCIALYAVRMFAVTAGYHRYFSHRSYKTSRFFQFVLAFVAQSSSQKSVLWWASIHRHHHKHSDTVDDAHSPRQRGFVYSHVGWIFDPRHSEERVDPLPDFAKYPELRLLQKFEQMPSILLGVATFLVFGWQGLIVGFFWSTVLLYHGTFFINSLAHVHGNQRYVTGDDSRNNWWLAVITGGEGWHNNHHAYQRAARQGFRWYEVDFTFYALTVLSWMGVVWDLGEAPADVVRNERPLGRPMIEKIARQLASSFDIEHLKARLPHLPSIEELKVRALEKYAHTPSMDEICARARELIEQAVAAQPSLNVATA